MTDNIFAVTFNSTDDQCWNHQQIQNKFDFEKCPMIFRNLDDAKKWISDIVDDVIIPLDGNIDINPDWHHDTDLDDLITTFGIGSGAFQPWMVIFDDDGVQFDFWIHQIDIH